MSAVVPDVAIVTHNTDLYLLNLLQSLEPLRASGSLGDVYVWDNASDDHTTTLLDLYGAGKPWLHARRSTTNLHHGPALDRLLREECQREWVLLLDSDTEVTRPFAPALADHALGDAAFVGQIHPQMPQLYAYLAHLLVHRHSYLELPPFRHHGAPGLDYFRAIEREQRPYRRLRWCDYVYHFGQGSLRRVADRGDRANEFYEFARNELVRQPTTAARRARESALHDALGRFLDGRRTRVATSATAIRDRGVDTRVHAAHTAARLDRVPRRRQRDGHGWVSLWPFRRRRALRRARRLGLVQMAAEIAELVRLVERQRPRTVLEIGTAHGGSFSLWAHAAAADATLVSVDLPPWELDDPGEIEKTRAIERSASPGQTVRLIRGDSHDASVRSRAHAALSGRPVDFLFIDGDHSYAGVRQDYHDYVPLVRPGGLVAVHDIHPHSQGWGGDVPRFWRELRDRHRHLELIADVQQDGYGLGVIWVDATAPVQAR